MNNSTCSNCDSYLEEPMKIEHVMTQGEEMNLMMECNSCGEELNVWTTIDSVKAI
jgi:RNase P subunit RPR2